MAEGITDRKIDRGQNDIHLKRLGQQLRIDAVRLERGLVGTDDVGQRGVLHDENELIHHARKTVSTLR